MHQAAPAHPIKSELEALRRFWKRRRDRVFLNAAQSALDEYAGVRTRVRGAYSHFRDGDDDFHRDFVSIEHQVSHILEEWKHAPSPAYQAAQEFIDWWTPGLYVIALTPQTRPVQIKVGRTDCIERCVLPYRRICPTLQVLQLIPATRFPGSIMAREADLIRRGKDHLMHLAGEVFLAPELADAREFADEMRRIYIGS